jgi:hypothetical protein
MMLLAVLLAIRPLEGASKHRAFGSAAGHDLDERGRKEEFYGYS